MISQAFRDAFDSVAAPVREGQRSGLYPFGIPLSSSPGAIATVNGAEAIMMSSNNYLGLANHPLINQAAQNALNQYGLSTCGSRLHSGTTAEHLALEAELADWLQYPDVMLFTSGFLANLGTITAVADSTTVIISDKLNHMSIVDGQNLATAAGLRIYAHRDTESLEYVLSRTQAHQKRLIVSDGVFSMDGDLAPVADIVHLAERYESMVMIDDAHGLGVLGATGRGSPEHFGTRADILMGSLSKALGVAGGFIGGPAPMIAMLRHAAHSYVFDVSLSPVLVAGARAALRLVQQDRWRQEKLWHNTIRFRSRLLSAGLDVLESVTPIIPIVIGDSRAAMRISRELLHRGVHLSSAVYPAVPEGTSRLRTTMSSALNEEHVDRAAGLIVEVCADHCIPREAA